MNLGAIRTLLLLLLLLLLLSLLLFASLVLPLIYGTKLHKTDRHGSLGRQLCEDRLSLRTAERRKQEEA